MQCRPQSVQASAAAAHSSLVIPLPPTLCCACCAVWQAMVNVTQKLTDKTFGLLWSEPNAWWIPDRHVPMPPALAVAFPRLLPSHPHHKHFVSGSRRSL